MHALLDYIDGFDPTFRQRIQGADATRIAELEALAGPLPPSYRAYLEHMGRHDGDLPLVVPARTHIDRVLQSYHEEETEAGEDIPADAILIGTGIAPHYDLCLLGHQDTARLAVTDMDDIVFLAADSLLGLLHQNAFIRYEVRGPGPLEQWATPAADELPKARALAQLLGFVQRPFSDSLCFCGALGDVRVCIRDMQASGLYFQVGALDPAALAQTVEGLKALG